MTRILIAEDDFGSRKMMQKSLAEYGEVDVVVDGQEAVHAFSLASDEGKPYNLVMLDIMMPRMDGHEALMRIRQDEKDRGVSPASEVPIVMTTVLEDPKNVVAAYYKGGATAYIVKPVDRLKLRSVLGKLGFKTS